MSLHFEPIWSWILTSIAVLAMLAVLASGYPRRIRHLPPGIRRILIGLRLAVAVLLVLLMLRPVVHFERQDRSDSILYLLVDASRSMSTPDGPGGLTRRAAALRTLQDAEEYLTAIAEKADVRVRDFSEGLVAVEKPDDVADGRMTAYGIALQQMSEEAGRGRVVSILIGDGKQAASGSLDADPLQAARLLGRQQRPVYAVALGSANSADTTLDLALEELDVSRDVYRGNVVPVRVRLKTKGAQGQTSVVRLSIEDRRNAVPGKSGVMLPVEATDSSKPLVSVTPASSDEESVIELRFVPDQVGELKLVAEVDALPGEVRRTNNRVETIIRVRQGGIRIVYYDIPRPEQKFIRRINVSSRVQVDFRDIRAGKLDSQTEVSDEDFQPGKYDAFIIGDVPASTFTVAQLNALYRCCNAGAGLMMLGGQNTYVTGGYGASPLAPLIPVELSGTETQLQEPQKLLPTLDGMSHYVMQIASPEQTRARWEQLPALAGANLLRRRDASLAQVLAESENGTPLLIGQIVGPTRVLAFAGDTTWQWVMKGFREEHQRFWRQVIFWLTHKENDTESPVWISAEPRDLIAGQTAMLSFGARNPDGSSVDTAEFEVSVTSPDGETHKVTPRSATDSMLGEFTETLAPGDYWAFVSASVGGEPRGTGITRFTVNSRDPELDNPAADPDMMRELGHLSGGDFLTPDDLLERLQDWADNGLPGAEIKRTERMTLWDNWYVLLLLVFLLTAEWALRKKRGLV